MVKPPQPSNDAPLRALEAGIHAVADTLFRRWPALVGFSVKDGNDADDELHLTVSMYPEPRLEDRSMVLNEIAEALMDLVDEAPAAASLLRARTFARALH
jgi:hypothetical protein